MLRGALVSAVCVALVLLVFTRPAVADIQAAGRLDATYAGNGQYRTWSAETGTGYIISRKDLDVSVGTSQWTIHGYAGAPANSKGPAATGYTVGADVYEFVVFIGTNNLLYIGYVVNGGTITWVAINSPFSTLTGHLAATTFLSSGNRYIAIGATATNGHLYRYVGYLGALPSITGGWNDASAGLTWLTDNPLAASVDASQSYPSIFAAHTAGAESLGLIRWNGSTWVTANLGRPLNKRACRSIAAAESSPTGLAGSERVLAACTPVNTVGEIYLATATAYNSTSFTWTTYTTPSGVWDQSVAAVTHNCCTLQRGQNIDVYASAVVGARLHKGVYTGTSFTLTDLGVVPEAGTVYAGLAAVPAGTTSRAFYVGDQNGRHYLYERYGGNTSIYPQNYKAFGDENPVAFDFGAGHFFAEGKIAIWQGTMAASVIDRPGTGGPSDFPRVYLEYSATEGGTQSYAVVPNVVDRTYNYVSDPTAVVTDQRTIYSIQEGVDVQQCLSEQGISNTIVYAVTTTPGTFPAFSAPIILDEQPNNTLDHPYADIQHRASAPDLIHVAWLKVGGYTAYTALVEGVTTPSVRQIGNPVSAVRVTATDGGRVVVYGEVATGNGVGYVKFCEVEDTDHDGIPETCCVNGPTGTCSSPINWDAGWQTVTPSPDPIPWQWSTPNSGLGPLIPGTADHIGVQYPVSMALSESGDTLYYCFDRSETVGGGAGTVSDAFCATGNRNPVSGLWTWNTPVALGGLQNDGKDQFDPEVVLTQESSSHTSGYETAVVTFYDRSDDPSNRSYRVKKTISTDRAVTFYPPIAQFAGASSDPEFLPHHCFHSGERFIGDYSGSEGYVDHAQSLSVLVPGGGGTIGASSESSFSSLGRWGQ